VPSAFHGQIVGAVVLQNQAVAHEPLTVPETANVLDAQLTRTLLTLHCRSCHRRRRPCTLASGSQAASRLSRDTAIRSVTALRT
jgi:hypothetical protein